VSIKNLYLSISYGLWASEFGQMSAYLKIRTPQTGFLKICGYVAHKAVAIKLENTLQNLSFLLGRKWGDLDKIIRKNEKVARSLSWST
jgi:hypothetical protein